MGRENDILSDEELYNKQKELEEREESLNKREKEINALDKKVTNAKYNLYARINTTKSFMDKVVIGISVLLVMAVIVGIATRG